MKRRAAEMHHVTDRLGFRGTSLVFLSLVWFAVGSRIVSNPDPDPSYALPLELFPVWVRVAVWWVPALIGFCVAWMSTAHGRLGFVALVIPASLRGFSFTAALPWHIELWIEAVVWLGIVGYILTLSAWPEPARRTCEASDGAP